MGFAALVIMEFSDIAYVGFIIIITSRLPTAQRAVGSFLVCPFILLQLDLSLLTIFYRANEMHALSYRHLFRILSAKFCFTQKRTHF